MVNIKEKIEKTNLEKYGAKSTLCKGTSVRTAIKNTNLEKYGSVSPLSSEEVKEKIKKTNLERYGSENVGSNEMIKEKIRNTNSVSIHVRRGDYCQLGLDIVGKEYYKKALDIIFSKVVEPQVFVFSDADVKDMFCDLKNINLNYITTNKKEKSFVDMYLMSECKHNIIANSTFSYWGAWINNNPEKIVIRPKMQTKDRETWKVQDWILL